MRFQISCPSSEGHNDKSDSGLTAAGDRGSSSEKVPSWTQGSTQTTPGHSWGEQRDLLGGEGCPKGSAKLKETLLGEKLLLVKLWTGAERVQALAAEAMCKGHADGHTSCGHMWPPACQALAMP